MSKHTPAPWIIKGQDIIGNELNGFICQWSGRSANARLISAAPDMLKFIENITDSTGPYTDLNGHQIVADAYKIMAKARGKS